MTQIEFQQIKKLLRFVWQSKESDFYRKKYQSEGFKNLPQEIKTPEDFLRVPFLTRQELGARSPFDRFYAVKDRMLEFSSTSGTTRQKPVLSLRPLPLLKDKAWRTKEQGIFKKSSRILYLNQPMRTAARLLDISDEDKKKAVIIVAGDPYNLAGTAYVAGQARIDAISTSFNLAAALAEHLKKFYDCRKIKFLRLVGELITNQRAAILRKLYPQAKIHSIYALSETRSLGAMCGFWQGGELLYHAAPHRFYESVDDELVVTSLGQQDLGTPLIRYKTGDAVRWTAKAHRCSCGRKGRTFKILGRVEHDFAKLAGGELREELIERALEKIPVIKNFRMHILEEKVGSTLLPKIVFEAALYYEVADVQDLAQKIASSIPISSKMTLKDAEEQGIILPLEIKIVSELSSPASKQNRIIFHQ